MNKNYYFYKMQNDSMPKVNKRRRSMSATLGVVISMIPMVLILSYGLENGQFAK